MNTQLSLVLPVADESAKVASLAHVLRFTGALTCGLQGRRERFPVASLLEASQKYCLARDASGEGASGWPPAVVFCDGRKVARISYNGRVWGMDGDEIQVDDCKTAKQLRADGFFA